MNGTEKGENTMEFRTSKDALIQRLRRRLQKDGQALRIARGSIQSYWETGKYYTIDISSNFIIHKDIDLEGFGRELGVLAPSEEI
jgi:hypothetical protein